MGALRTPREKWIEEGLRVLAEQGVDAVRVEVLARALGVTKGGFYGYFGDRDALLAAMLDAWEHESVDDVIERARNAEGDIVDQARIAGQLTFSNDRLLPIDLAVRAWARRDPVVAERLHTVDNRRMQVLREAISSYCSDPGEVEARSLAAFCLAIGRHLIAADHAGRARDQVVADAATLILGRAAGPAAP
ncbi:TetR/AcrR family transcriptional regulator [Microbacterium sp. I2]|jgi:AcrR family transcriptional regulator|uniref:TetR/AcrR family transcriptional regulator n=1 Tax=Microbacterium sp. I2 TaxID=3391826 RepID=UPI003EDA3D61